MGPEFLNEQAEWEARRVAAAFEVGAFTGDPYNCFTTDFRSNSQEIKIRWTWTIEARPEKTTLTLRLFVIVEEGEVCQVGLADVLGESEEEDVWSLYSCGRSHDLMVRGLYRLGFEDEGVLSQLPKLSAHEKLELRLSMPREFWPRKWLDEEAEVAAKRR